MTNSEKKGIIILIVIGVIFVIALNVFAKKPKDETKLADADVGQNTSVEQQSNQPVTNPNTEGMATNDETQATEDNEYNKDLNVTKTLEEMQINGIQVKYSEGLTVITGDVVNTAEENRGGFILDVELVDGSGNKLAKLPAYIPVLKPGESAKIETSDIQDLTKTVDVEVSRQILN